MPMQSVPTTAARYQNLFLNPLKLSGQCGRLKCCLNYELDVYVEALQEFPEENTILKTTKGTARVEKTDILKRIMWFRYMDAHPNANATSIFTSSGKAAREFARRATASMVGVNIGVAAPMAFFPFGGAKNSFFGDLKAHGRDALMKYIKNDIGEAKFKEMLNANHQENVSAYYLAWAHAVEKNDPSAFPVDPKTGNVVSSDIKLQTRQCLENLKTRLEESGSSLDKVVWANWSLRDPTEFDIFNEEWIRWFPGDAPGGQGTLLPSQQRWSKTA